VRRRLFLKTMPLSGVAAIAGCFGDSRTKTVGLKIDNQTGSDSDVSVVISKQNTTEDEKHISVSKEEIKTVETSISNPGIYTVEITTGNQTGEFTHSIDQQTIDDELQIVVIIYPDKIRSYIQE
jgi:PKD repeat protein